MCIADMMRAREDILRMQLDSALSKVEQLKTENAKLREQIVQLQVDWESERNYANQMEAKEKKAVSENEKLRETCSELLRVAEHNDPEWFHWPEIHEELPKLRIEVK